MLVVCNVSLWATISVGFEFVGVKEMENISIGKEVGENHFLCLWQIRCQSCCFVSWTKEKNQRKNLRSIWIQKYYMNNVNKKRMCDWGESNRQLASGIHLSLRLNFIWVPLSKKGNKNKLNFSATKTFELVTPPLYISLS